MTATQILTSTTAAAFSVAAITAWYTRRFRTFAFTLWVLAFVSAATAYPTVFISWHSFELKRTIVPLIQIIMLGMGLTLTLDDFVRVLRMPRGVFVGMLLQFTVMPVMGWVCSEVFALEAEVATGMILIGACSGGVASNLITYLAKANVALSVSMTACSTFLAPIATPLAMKILAGRYVSVEFWPMLVSIMKMIVFPTMLGVFLNCYARGISRRAGRFLPVLSMLGICFIIAITVALSRDKLIEVGAALFAACVCHNLVGFALGYLGARMLGLDHRDSRTVSIEVGLQNGGMATGLAFEVLKSPIAALASAVFGPWSAVAGSALASWWRSQDQISMTFNVPAERVEDHARSDRTLELAPGQPQ